MKTDRKKQKLYLFFNCSLLLSLGLSGVVSYSLFNYPTNAPLAQKLSKVSLTNSILLFIILVLLNLLFQKRLTPAVDEKHHIDPLTGFMTRHAFREVFDHALLDAKRSLAPLSVIIIDIDHFRTINEKHGHQIADIMFAMLSKSVDSALRASDITCRWDGDQILIVLKDCSIKHSDKIAEKMLLKIREQSFESEKNPVRISASIGLAQMVSNDTAETLAARAETGLHSARDNGRNCCAIGYDWILIDYAGTPIF